jgi:hypothetical protein
MHKSDYDTHDCDFNTHKSEFYKHSVILTRMSVIMTRMSVIMTRVCFTHAQRIYNELTKTNVRSPKNLDWVLTSGYTQARIHGGN